MHFRVFVLRAYAEEDYINANMMIVKHSDSSLDKIVTHLVGLFIQDTISMKGGGNLQDFEVDCLSISISLN